MKKYRRVKNGVFDVENNCYIQSDAQGYKQKEYQNWLDEGNEPDPIEIVPELTKTEIYERYTQHNKLFKSLIKSLNDGTFVPGSKYSVSKIKSIITYNM